MILGWRVWSLQFELSLDVINDNECGWMSLYVLQELFANVKLTDLQDAVAADMHCHSFTSSY